MRPQVADLLRVAWEEVQSLNSWQIRTLKALRDCRTAALGGHIDACTDCGTMSISYNSCRNRHCPKCQGEKKNAWMEARENDLLPVPYFHVVFTLPDVLHPLAMHQPQAVYVSLFEAAWKTLEVFAKNMPVPLRSGMIALLHTWGQNLMLHPHLHCIVPAGGISKNGEWKQVKKNGKFLFPVKAMSKVFRAKYAAALRSRIEVPPALSRALFAKEWVIYAKRPFGGPKAVVEYLGRYSHKVAISNARIKELSPQTVAFSYKDYRAGARNKIMRLSCAEFIRRFALHILPLRFVRIRHYGILSSTWKREKLKALQQRLWKGKVPQHKTRPHRPCPCCKQGTLITLISFGVRGPPPEYAHLLHKTASPAQA